MDTTEFRTRGCKAHGHREITIRFAKQRVPGIEKLLLSYFEGGVARGVRFEPRQTVQLGWSVLRLCDRTDGTLGVLEQTTEDDWSESVDDALMDTWRMKEVAASLGVLERLAFPQQQQVAMTCNALHEGESWALTRDPPKLQDSGWTIVCLDPEHDHDDPDNMVSKTLLQLGWELPFLRQFFALPPGIEIAVTPAEVSVVLGGTPLAPQAGSYLAAVLAKRTS